MTKLLIAMVVSFGLFMLMGPFGSPNIRELNESLRILIIVGGGVVTFAIGMLFGSGSNVQVGGRGNMIDASTKNIEIHERGPSGAVRRYMEDD